MNRVYLLIGGATILGLVYIVAPMVLSTYRRYRGRRTIVCPETGQIVEVDLKAGRAGIMALFGGKSAPVDRCTQWPRRQCTESCVAAYWDDPEQSASNTEARTN